MNGSYGGACESAVCRSLHPCQRPILIFELEGDGIRSKKVLKCFIRHCPYQSPYRVVLAGLRSPYNHFNAHSRILVELGGLLPDSSNSSPIL
jgi:hypothetical protein